jgi:hypothetical protein
MALTPEVRSSQAQAFAITGAKSVGINTSMAQVMAVYNFPSIQLRTSQLAGMVVTKSSNTVRVMMAQALAVVIGIKDEHNLRAFTFTQDDHDFYVLKLGVNKTFVYDKLTSQWSQWQSPRLKYWRVNDGCGWQGINVGCDSLSGDIFQIDPVGRLDYLTTPIVSQIFSGKTFRFRTFQPCYMAELSVSENGPPAGIDPTTVGIQLRSSDTINWTDHGTVTAQAAGTQTYARWYGLGLMKSPGILFEITDTGYARRIDAFTIEIGGQVSG